MVKRLSLRQPHPDPQLQPFWDATQLAILLIPFSSLLSSVGISIISLALLKVRFRAIAQRRLNWGLLVVGLLMLTSALFATYQAEAFLGLANFLPFFIVFAALSELIQTPAQLRRIAWILVLSSVPVVLIGLGQQFWGWTGSVELPGSVVSWMIYPTGNPPGRMSSIFFYANVLASYLVITLPLNLGLLIEEMLRKAEGRGQRAAGKKKAAGSGQRARGFGLRALNSRIAFLTIVLLGNAIALILTNSRNAWAIAVFAFLAFALYLGWRWLIVGVTVVAGAVLGAAFAPSPFKEGLRAIVPAFFWARLTDELYPNRPYAELRTTLWKFALSLAQQRPWLGWGLRNFSPIYQSEMHFFIGHPHNLVLMLAAETGLPATFLLVGVVGWVVFQGSLLLYFWSSERRASEQNLSPALHLNSADRLILFTFLTTFAGCALFSLLDITLFDVRINLLGWLLLAGIGGVTHHCSRWGLGTAKWNAATQ